MILYHGSNMAFRTPSLPEVLRRMRFTKKLTTQYSFHTTKALRLLTFKEVRHV